MRAPVIWSMLFVAAVLLAAGCNGAEQQQKKVADACERQLEQLKEEADEESIKVAKTSQDAVEAEHLVECAGQPVQHATEQTGEGEDATADEAASDDAPAELTPALLTEQRDTFSKTCATCHTLADAKATGSFGPSLDESSLTAEEMATKIENGGGGMPEGLLSGDDAEAMAAYLAQVRASK